LVIGLSKEKDLVRKAGQVRERRIAQWLRCSKEVVGLHYGTVFGEVQEGTETSAC
jgi:hypothetical protein